jgi:eukaryotic-like serine/threonine-protein kinase
VITLKALNGQTGDALASEQVQADGKEQVLGRLGEAATNLRAKLGESSGSIKQFNAPLPEATTSSIDALKAFALGNELNSQGKSSEAVAALKLAVELDPDFALGYASLGSFYRNANQPALATEAARKAFELRSRATERERLRITASYYTTATGEIPKAIEILELYVLTYPRDSGAHLNLSNQYYEIGEYEKTITELESALRLNPTSGVARANLANVYNRLNRFDEARIAGEGAIENKFDNSRVRSYLYEAALMRGDQDYMQQQINWANGRQGEYYQIVWQAWTAGLLGQWTKARDLSKQAIAVAEQRKLTEESWNIASSDAVKAAILGRCDESRAVFKAAKTPTVTPYSLFRVGIASALCGDGEKMRAQVDEAEQRYPQYTVVQEVHLPVIRAAFALQSSKYADVIQILQPVAPYDRIGLFFPNYLRGIAYLGEKNGAEAEREFQTIIDHHGWNALTPVYALAHLGVARALTLQGKKDDARTSYEEFLTRWKEADPDLLPMIQAKKEYMSLK